MANRFKDLASAGVDDHFVYALELLVQAHIQEVARHRGQRGACPIRDVAGSNDPPPLVLELPNLATSPGQAQSSDVHSHFPRFDELGNGMEGAQRQLGVQAPATQLKGAPPYADMMQAEKEKEQATGLLEDPDQVFQAPQLHDPCQGQDSCLDDLDKFWVSEQALPKQDTSQRSSQNSGQLRMHALTHSLPETDVSMNSRRVSKHRQLSFSPDAVAAHTPSVICTSFDVPDVPDSRHPRFHNQEARLSTTTNSSKTAVTYSSAGGDDRKASKRRSHGMSIISQKVHMMERSESACSKNMSTSTNVGTSYESRFKSLEETPPRQGRCGFIADHPYFEMSFALLIFLNTITTCLEAQYDGIDIGHKLGIPGYSRSAAEVIPPGRTILDVLEILFGVLFTSEVLIKLCGLRLRFFYSGWNIFDLSIMGFWNLSNVISTDNVANPTMLRLLRLLKVMRIVRLFNTLSSVDSLLVLVKSLRGSFSAFVWCSCLIVVMITFVSLVVHSMMFTWTQDESNPLEARQDVWMHFGTFSRTASSFFEVTLGNFAPIMKVLTKNVDESWSLFVITYKLVGGFAVITVIRGVFLQETFKVAASDDDLMLLKQRRQMIKHMRKMTRLFQTADTKGTNTLTWKNFNKLLGDPFIRSWLAAYEFEVSDVKLVFDLMDDGDGRLSVDELMTGVSRLKGFARSIDLHVLLFQVNETKRMMAELRDELGISKSSQV